MYKAAEEYGVVKDTLSVSYTAAYEVYIYIYIYIVNTICLLLLHSIVSQLP